MKKSKWWQRKSFELLGISLRFRLSWLKKWSSRILFVLAIVLVLATAGYAETAAKAHIVFIKGNRLFFKIGSQIPVAAQLYQFLENRNQALIVPGDETSFANLVATTDPPVDSARYGVQVGPNSADSHYLFPCRAGSGQFTISWEQGNHYGCEDGVTKSLTEWQNSKFKNREFLARKATKALQIAQGNLEVTIVPNNNTQKLVRTYDSEFGIEVETMIGDILVKSDRYPEGRLIRERQRYSYPQDTIEPLDYVEIANLPEMKDFLNPENWSSPELPSRAANSIAKQIENHRVALGMWRLDFPSHNINGSCTLAEEIHWDLVKNGNEFSGQGGWQTCPSSRSVCRLPLSGIVRSGQVQITSEPVDFTKARITFEGSLAPSGQYTGSVTLDTGTTTVCPQGEFTLTPP